MGVAVGDRKFFAVDTVTVAEHQVDGCVYKSQQQLHKPYGFLIAKTIGPASEVEMDGDGLRQRRPNKCQAQERQCPNDRSEDMYLLFHVTSFFYR